MRFNPLHNTPRKEFLHLDNAFGKKLADTHTLRNRERFVSQGTTSNNNVNKWKQQAIQDLAKETSLLLGTLNGTYVSLSSSTGVGMLLSKEGLWGHSCSYPSLRNVQRTEEFYSYLIVGWNGDQRDLRMVRFRLSVRSVNWIMPTNRKMNIPWCNWK